MNRDQIIQMARAVWGDSAILPFDELEQFAALVAAAEREQCAKVCEELGTATNGIYERNHECATAIRARSQS
jgi:hypothetical protein